MNIRAAEHTRIIRKSPSESSDAAADGHGSHTPFLILGVVTTLLVLGFSYLVYDTRLTARATGNRVLRTEITAGEVVGDDDAPVPAPSAMRLVAGAVSVLDDIARDAMFAIRGPGKHAPTSDEIAVIAIDEDSLVRHATWPWPRTDIARLMQKAENARVIGMDILFPDRDKTSLARYLPQLSSLFQLSVNANSVDPTRLDNDLLLAQQMARTPTVLGSVLFDGMAPSRRLQHSAHNHHPALELPDGTPVSEEDVLLEDARYEITSIGRLRDNGDSPVGEGFINLFPLASGVMRSIPILARVSNEAFITRDTGNCRIQPSLPLEVMRVYLGGDSYKVHLSPDPVFLADFDESGHVESYAVEDLSIRKNGEDLMTMPLSEFADMEVTFRNHWHDYVTYPAWEVLAGMHDGKFKDKIVLVGGTTAAVGYVVSAGLQTPEVSTVTAHAAMIAAMLKGDFFRNSYRQNYFWRQIFILVVGLIVTAAIVFGDVALGAAVAIICAIGVFFIDYAVFFIRGVDVGVTLPILSGFAVLAVLTASNYLSVGRERRFIRRAFALNVSPSILSYLESHPDRLSSLQGEQRNMTVLFSDIRNFTAMSERMAASDLARFLNEYFTPMSDIVMRTTGTVDKFIGDGLMAFWNAPTDNPGHARDAARAALGMVEKLAELQPAWTDKGLPKISIGCGINTGMMFAGNMGSEQRKNYTVMGDNVNIASRLENLNKVYSSSILVTESTREQLGRDFVCRVVDKVRVSGKESPIMIYELLGTGPTGEEKLEELAAFSRVFELYQQQEFATAETLLKELVFIRPAPLYKLYLDRLAVYKALPPPADWDGTFAKMTK